jgi:hypothetical protein
LSRWRSAAVAVAALLLLVSATPVAADSFEKQIAQIDHALETNPSGVTQQALDACKSMRDMAVKLYKLGKPDRAERRLKMCRRLLELR